MLEYVDPTVPSSSRMRRKKTTGLPVPQPCSARRKCLRAGVDEITRAGGPCRASPRSSSSRMTGKRDPCRTGKSRPKRIQDSIGPYGQALPAHRRPGVRQAEHAQACSPSVRGGGGGGGGGGGCDVSCERPCEACFAPPRGPNTCVACDRHPQSAAAGSEIWTPFFVGIAHMRSGSV